MKLKSTERQPEGKWLIVELLHRIDGRQVVFLLKGIHQMFTQSVTRLLSDMRLVRQVFVTALCVHGRMIRFNGLSIYTYR